MNVRLYTPLAILALATSLSLGCDSKADAKATPQETKTEPTKDDTATKADTKADAKANAGGDATRKGEEKKAAPADTKKAAADEMNGGDGAPNEMPETPEDGEYTNVHGVLVEPDSDKLEDATDCLTVSVLGSGSVEFDVALYFNMDHSCELSGEAQPKTNGSLVYTGSKATEDEGCTLAIVTKGDTITLKDEGMKCSPVWCGARGTLDGATFARSTKRKATGKCGG